jgi:hypothetical protein
MMKALPLCVLGLVIATGVAAAGQPFSLSLEDPGLPASPPAVPVAAEAPCPPPPTGPATAPGVFTADLDYVLWFFPFRDNDKERTVAVSGPRTASSTGILSTLREEGLNRFVSGGRLTLGYWLVEPNPWVTGGIRTCGVEGNVFAVGAQSADFRDAGSTILRPFESANSGLADNVVVAFPGLATGSLEVSAKRRDFYGAEVNIWKNVDYDYPGTNCSFDVLAGGRYLSMSQSVEIHRKTIFQNDLARFPDYRFLAGNTLDDTDFFQTHNRFLGGQVGVAGRFHCLGFTLEGLAKLALGATQQRYLIQGQQIRTLPDGTTIYSPGGLLALPSNSGRFTRTRFAEVPELTVNARWRVTDNLGVHVGFTTLRWNEVSYPGDQVTTARDISEIPNFPGGDTAPRVSRDQLRAPLRSSSLWLSGITFGAELAW